jgi:hypothetical protein
MSHRRIIEVLLRPVAMNMNTPKLATHQTLLHAINVRMA